MELPPYISKTKDGFVFFVKVTPKSGKQAIVGLEDNKLKIKLRSPPEKGGANAELILFLSDLLSIKKSQIRILSGETSRIKKIVINVSFSQLAELVSLYEN